MNYLTEILAFNDLLLSNRMSTGQIALWYALMYIDNKCGWAEWFTAPNRTLESHTDLTRDGIAKARNALRQKGLIEFRSNGTKATAYRLVPISNRIQPCIQGSIQGRMQDDMQGGIQEQPPLNKQNKIKQKEIKYTAAHAQKSKAPKESPVKKSKFNNYDDTRQNDYAAVEERLLELQLGELT